jgi:2-methylisocitrate lyase-like PEP mutase family enzyme
MDDYGARLRDLIAADEVYVSPGVHAPLSARVVDGLDFDLVSMTGNWTSVARLGMPDAGLITLPEMVENARRIQETVDVPVIADADNGYGNAINAVRTAREFATAGVAGFHMEDQVFPKRCGHEAGKRVIGRDEAVGKVRAAAETRDEHAPEMVVIARTDARGAEGGSLDEAIDRANAYCAAGADMAFLQGPEDRDEVARIGSEVAAPLLYNVSGSSPKLPPDELADLGFDLVMYPRLSSLATILGVREAATALGDDPGAALADLQAAFDDLPYGGFNEFAGFDRVREYERRYGPDAVRDGDGGDAD